jgi:SAM-dependent methyltransferase
MALASAFYRSAYRFGRPAWDTEEARPELVRFAESHQCGRALDIGCGTGTNALYLAGHGWDVVGIDLVASPIEAARRKAEAQGCAAAAHFVVGDACRLRRCGIQGPFDLVIDVGCYHSVPTGRRRGYAREVAAVTRAGADLYIAGISRPPASWRVIRATGVTGAELRSRFGGDFELEGESSGGTIGRLGGLAVHHLVRR